MLVCMYSASETGAHALYPPSVTRSLKLTSPTGGKGGGGDGDGGGGEGDGGDGDGGGGEGGGVIGENASEFSGHSQSCNGYVQPRPLRQLPRQ